ncbi:HNH endonuclease [Fusibacter ferrireducens]|uniref:HNH endonuclease 5 domain-containing protein n=1 Tax=Fusibacter ferrireducens TaxID=2785058 RepID=A0ABR9ZZM8_9FIRM|nr:HNH endonuclease [Fusibacter ferrireducens]MBF4695905.1 hypothetical protein [Fusibacter ferrireducens]
MKKCIYCLQLKKDSEFTIPEHALNQSFGKFKNNLTSYDVCHECNSYFGKNLDNVLARDSVFGFERFMKGIKKANEYKHLGRKSKNVYKADIGILKDLKSYPVIENGEIRLMIDSNQVSLKNFETGEFDLFLLDDLPKKELLNNCYRDKDNHISLVYQFKDGEVNRILKNKNYMVDASKITKTFEDGKVEISREQDVILSRALSKIIFTIFSLKVGLEISLCEDFNKIREFIRYGRNEKEMMNCFEVYKNSKKYNDNNQINGHIVTLKNDNGIWIGEVSFFADFTFTIPLGVDHVNIGESHYLLYDLDILELRTPHKPTSNTPIT